MAAVHPTRTIYGWKVEEEARPDGLQRLICRNGNRLMDLRGTPDTSRDQLYERGIEALLSDDAHAAIRANDHRGVLDAEYRLRHHRQVVAAKRLERIHQRVQRDRELIVCGRIRR